LDYFLQFHKKFLKTCPAIIAITHYDDDNTETLLIEYHQYVRSNDFSCAVMRLDAREKADVLRVVAKLTNEIIRCRAKAAGLKSSHF
jgi:hypothetical protein